MKGSFSSRQQEEHGFPSRPFSTWRCTKTILEKIDRAQMFVGDVTIVNQGAPRLTPNPNVVHELGYARRALGDERIIMVLNTAYGVPKDLPFDLNHQRAVSYYLPKEADESLSRPDIRRNLENSLKEHILAILKLDEPRLVAVVSFAEKAMIAIREGHPDMPARVRDYMADLVAKIPLIPPTNKQDILDEQLVQAIGASTALVVEFAQVVTIIAERNVVEAAQTVYGP